MARRANAGLRLLRTAGRGIKPGRHQEKIKESIHSIPLSEAAGVHFLFSLGGALETGSEGLFTARLPALNQNVENKE